MHRFSNYFRSNRIYLSKIKLIIETKFFECIATTYNSYWIDVFISTEWIPAHNPNWLINSSQIKSKKLPSHVSPVMRQWSHASNKWQSNRFQLGGHATRPDSFASSRESHLFARSIVIVIRRRPARIYTQRSLTSSICSMYSWNLSLHSCSLSISLASARFLMVETSSWPAFVTWPRSPACSIVVWQSCWRRSRVARNTPRIAASRSVLGEPVLLVSKFCGGLERCVN